MEWYKDIVIDFHGIEFMGRGFADEVFRVSQSEHLERKITPLHASTSMMAMIRYLGGVAPEKIANNKLNDNLLFCQL